MGLDFDMDLNLDLDLDLDNLPRSPLSWPARGGCPGFGSHGQLAGIGAGGGDTICKCLPY
jgi:hypothetical protein